MVKACHSQFLNEIGLSRRFIRAYEEAIRLRNLMLSAFMWMHELSSGLTSRETLRQNLKGKVAEEVLDRLYEASLRGPSYIRNRSRAALFRLRGIQPSLIACFLGLRERAVKNYYRRFKRETIDVFLRAKHKEVRKEDDSAYRDALLAVLHAPPSNFGFNRTTWTRKLLSKVMKEKGHPVGHNTVGKIIRNAGFRFRKARTVLTSNDPEYKKKLRAIKRILSRLGQHDRFFSIDEFGPFAVKKRGGRRLVRENEYPTIPQWQISKGFLIVTAALELSTNQVTHFYSKKKDTEEMLKLLDILLKQYHGCRRIYLSWDGASWHSSKRFLDKIRNVNKQSYRNSHNTPVVKLAPLPARAQFLNVIESVFSGMATAIIHNSDYRSVDEAKAAIDRYFVERNENFRKHPKRAGKKIWGNERVLSSFKESQNCKHNRWR